MTKNLSYFAILNCIFQAKLLDKLSRKKTGKSAAARTIRSKKLVNKLVPTILSNRYLQLMAYARVLAMSLSTICRNKEFFPSYSDSIFHFIAYKTILIHYFKAKLPRITRLTIAISAQFSIERRIYHTVFVTFSKE